MFKMMKMKVIIITITVTIIAFATVTGFSKQLTEEDKTSVDDIINRYLDAIGGEKNLKAVQSKAILYKVFMQTRKGYLVERTIHRKGTLKSKRLEGSNYLFFDGTKLWNIKDGQKNELKGKVVDQFQKMADLGLVGDAHAGDWHRHK